ncbi:aminoacyl-tRNA deacylase [Glutamicibacter creatinolyticus]|uniref:aminoacyl-tRNA deacylase n=1 Tax=Glutamicibacter creatinolyticus TaxID=162496 RepID=UPI003217BCF8
MTESPEAPNEVLTRISLDASRRNIPIEIVPRAAASSLSEAAANLGIAEHRLLKTLVLKRSNGTYLFALIPGGRSLSWPKLRSVLGVNKLSLPHGDTAFEVTGYRPGTITPFGALTPLPLVIDATVFQGEQQAMVALGSGDRLHAVLVAAQDLVSGFDATVADISVPE